MKAMDRQHLETPFCGSNWLKAWLGRWVSPKRVRQLVRIAGPWARYTGVPAAAGGRRGTGLSLSLEQREGHPSQPGVGRRHHPPAHDHGRARLRVVMDWTAATWLPADRSTLSPVLGASSECGRPCPRLETGELRRAARGIQHRPEPAPGFRLGRRFTVRKFTRVLQD